MNKVVLGKQYEKELRRKATPAERKFKTLITGIKKKYKLKFIMKFQKGWYEGEGFYISDFYFPSSKVTIELDGRSHELRTQKLQDQSKSIYLANMGIRTLRIVNSVIYGHTIDSMFNYLVRNDVIK